MPILSMTHLSFFLRTRFCTSGSFIKSLISKKGCRQLGLHNIHSQTEGQTDTLHKSCIKHWNDCAVIDTKGSSTYADIYCQSLRLSQSFKKFVAAERGHTVALLLPNDASYVVSLFAVWIAKLIAVPLFPNHPEAQLGYYLEDCKCKFVITDEKLASKCSNVFPSEKVLVLNHTHSEALETDGGPLTANDECLKMVTETTKNLKNDLHSDALIIYTSGSTGPPKGVVLNHGNIRSQVDCLLDAWRWSSSDVILHCLPLNHTHGIVNALLCPLFCGAKVRMEPSFDASSVWSKLLNLNSDVALRVNVFMAVPSIYVKLIEEYEKSLDKSIRRNEFVKSVCSENIRLMVSGSAPLPVPIFEQWRRITGHSLLERYGMTEIGMALSNPLDGDRKPGFVGTPLPGVNVKIAKFSPKRNSYETLCEGTSKGSLVTSGTENESGELLVKGRNVFRGYWRRKEATEKEFTKDGWFCTGDTAAFIDGSYKILGRTSVDIIKTGGFKVSALDVERALLSHPDIGDAAVVGIPDLTWGEKVAAVITWNGRSPFDLAELRSWAKERIAHYQVPSEVKVLPRGIPRNAMGKVNKKELVKSCFKGK